MKRYTIIAKIKTSMPEAAQEVLTLMGEGARPDAEQVECFFARNNTPVSNGYCRVIVDEHIAMALDYMLGNNMTGEHIDCIRVEWQGQDRVPVEQPIIDENGNPTGETETVYVEQLFQTGTQDVRDEQGNVIATTPVYLGRF